MELKFENFFQSVCQMFSADKMINPLQMEEHRDYKMIYHQFRVTPSQIQKAAIILTLLYSIALSLLFNIIHLQLNLVLFFLFSALFVYNKLEGFYLKKIREKERELDILTLFIKFDIDLSIETTPYYEDLTLKVLTTLMRSYPNLSEYLTSLMVLIRKGEPPEKVIDQIIPPSFQLKEILKQVIHYSEYSRNLPFLNEDRPEVEFQGFSKSLESRLNIVFFLGMFFPLGLSFFMMLQQISPWAVLFSIPFFELLLSKATSSFLQGNVSLLGFSLYDSEELKNEFAEFLKFYREFIFKLQVVPPESAFIRSYRIMQPPLKEKLTDSVEQLMKYKLTFVEALRRFQDELQNPKCKILIQNMHALLSENSEKTAIQLLNVLKRIEDQMELQKEREIILKGEKIKVVVFSALLPIILGIISGILPVLANMLQISTTTSPFDFPFTVGIASGEILVYALAQIILVWIAVTKFNEMLVLPNIRRKQIIGVLIFIFSFLIAIITAGNLSIALF